MCTIGISNRLDPDQAGHFIGPDLDPNFLQRLSADDNSIQIVTIVSSEYAFICQKFPNNKQHSSLIHH